MGCGGVVWEPPVAVCPFDEVFAIDVGVSTALPAVDDELVSVDGAEADEAVGVESIGATALVVVGSCAGLSEPPQATTVNAHAARKMDRCIEWLLGFRLSP